MAVGGKRENFEEIDEARYPPLLGLGAGSINVSGDPPNTMCSGMKTG
jgi:hypothetical protein